MKPLVYERLKISARTVKFDLKFRNNITLITGNSGSGKTYLYEVIKDHIEIGELDNVICISTENKNDLITQLSHR